MKSHESQLRGGFLLPLAVLIVIQVMPEVAQAVPVFARKYQKSCQTCHVAFPKLTPFGEAFRRNGYRFPAGEDEDATQDEPVALGHEAHKKVFPDAVWPAEIPGLPPISTQFGSAVTFNDEAPEVSFANVGGNIGFNFAATLDATFSAWAGAAIRGSTDGGAEAELERVFVVVQPFDEPTAVFRVGRMEPSVTAVTMHRTLGFAPWIISSRVGDNEFAVDPTQLGIEVNGIIASGRLSYAAGLVEGAGNELNAPKDGYARVAYKLGGMRLDGVGGATEPEPWRETSVQIGAFGYYGRATIGEPLVATQTDRFYLAGGDLSLGWRDLNLVGAFAITHNRRPLLASPREEANGWHVYAQADYVIYPWMIPTVRYERRSVADVQSDRISGGLYFLIRSNVRAQALVSVEGDDDGNYDLSQGLVGLNMAF